jgi:hypothetical protein
MFFRECRLKMTAETDATTYGFHSTAVKKDVDITVVFDAILEDGVGSFQAGRAGAKGETVDLFARGLEMLGSGKRIANYKKHMAKDFNIQGMRRYKSDSDNNGDGEDDNNNDDNSGDRADREIDDGEDRVEFDDILNLADSNNDDHDREWDDADDADDVDEDMEEYSEDEDEDQ